MSVYENTRTIVTHTKLETHLVNNDCVLFRETQTYTQTGNDGTFKSGGVAKEPFVHEGTMTADQLRKRLAGKPHNPGFLVGAKAKKGCQRRRVQLSWYPDEWIAKMRANTFERNEMYSMGRQDVYTAIVDEGLSPDNLLARDSYDHCIYTRYGTEVAQAVVFDYISADVNAGHFRDLEGVAAKLLEREDIRIYVAESWSNRSNNAKDPKKAVDNIPHYNASRSNGGRAVQFVWSPSQEEYDRVRAQVNDDVYRRRDMIAAALDMDLFGINQFRYTDEERKLIEEAYRGDDD